MLGGREGRPLIGSSLTFRLKAADLAVVVSVLGPRCHVWLWARPLVLLVVVLPAVLAQVARHRSVGVRVVLDVVGEVDGIVEGAVLVVSEVNLVLSEVNRVFLVVTLMGVTRGARLD